MGQHRRRRANAVAARRGSLGLASYGPVLLACFVNCTLIRQHRVPESRATAPLPPKAVEVGGSRATGPGAYRCAARALGFAIAPPGIEPVSRVLPLPDGRE